MRPTCILALMMGAWFLGTPDLMAKQQGSEAMESRQISADREWRMTKRGWQDSSVWRIDMQAMSRPIERIHPVLLGVNIVLASLFALIWCSDEQQVARFLRKPGTGPEDNQPTADERVG